MAESPQLLTGFLTVNAGFEQSDLDPVEREVVVLTVATRNECHFCVAMHTATLTRHGATPELIAALRAGTALPEPGWRRCAGSPWPCSTTGARCPTTSWPPSWPPATSPGTPWTWCSASARTPSPPSPTGSPGAPLDPPLAAHAWTPAA